MRIGIAITRAAAVDSTWTTLDLACVALARGHVVRFVEPWDFEVDPSGDVLARTHAFDRPTTAEAMAEALVNRTATRRYVDVARLDLLLLRAAPLDAAVLTFAGLAAERGVPVVNPPGSVLKVSHKAWLASLPGVRTPPTLVTRSTGAALAFYDTHRHGVVVKPARGSGGRGVAWVVENDLPGLEAAVAAAREVGDGYVVLQPYLSAAEGGEKRMVWFDGRVLGGYLRQRGPNEFRHNLARGGTAEPCKADRADLAAIATVTPHLLRSGIRLAGLDLIGGLITEVNTLNPGGTFHTDRLAGTRIADTVVAALEAIGSSPVEENVAHG